MMAPGGIYWAKKSKKSENKHETLTVIPASSHQTVASTLGSATFEAS